VPRELRVLILANPLSCDGRGYWMQFSQLKRREFISLLGGATAAWPLAARAQPPKMPVIGFLDPGSPEKNRVDGFRLALADAGYVDGRNVAIEFRWANAQFARLPALAQDLVERRVAVIVASGGVGAALAAKAATSTVPIVFVGGADPVRYGLVASLNRPGGNITGVTVIHNELAGKRLSLLAALVPQGTTVAYLVDDQHFKREAELTSDLLAAARGLGLQVIVLECLSSSDFESAFATLVERRVGALLVSAFTLAFTNRDKILALAAHHQIPAMYPQPQYAYEGGLMSYFAAVTQRQVVVDYVAPILKGAKPADLPIRQPTTFHLVINFKTAKALGLTIPPTLLAIADEVIE
jgi:putative ABC transport system substrate-binding protein